MPEIQGRAKAKKVHPRILNTILTTHPLEVPNPHIDRMTEVIDPVNFYDAVLLNDRLASIPIEGINTSDLRTLVPQILDKQNEFAFGAGFEGAVRQTLTSSKRLEQPFDSKVARFDNPGEIWLVTKTTGSVLNEGLNSATKHSAYGLMPLERAYADIELEHQRRVLSPTVNRADNRKAFKGVEFPEGFKATDRPATFKVEQALILPPIIADYTRALRRHSLKNINNPEGVDVEAFRRQYFKIDSGKPTEVLEKIMQEYLGDTTWGTVLSAELLIRLADYGIGHIPFVGPVWDFLQASTGKEFPLPIMERSIRHVLRDKNLPLPEGVFDKTAKGRGLEVAETLLGFATHLFPPALLAKIPVGTVLEAAIYVDKMKKSQEYFKPFLEIAESTGTKPKVIDQVSKVSKMPVAVIKNTVSKIGNKIKKPKLN